MSSYQVSVISYQLSPEVGPDLITSKTKAFALEYVKTIGIINIGTNGVGFANPSDIAFGGDGRIFVINRHDAPSSVDPRDETCIRVGIFNFDEDYLGEFGHGFGQGEGQLVLPAAMAFDSRERLHITDEDNHRVTLFDTEGRVLDMWGELGEGDGQLNGPSGIAIDGDDNVYIADQHNHRMQKFTTDGRYIAGWGGPGGAPGQLNMPWGVTVSPDGDVYVADWRNDRVQRFTSDGELVASYGESGGGDGQFRRPSSVAVDGDGCIYVADWGNERVQVLGPDGSFLLKLRGQATLSRWAEAWHERVPDMMEKRQRANLHPELAPHLSPHQVSAQIEAYFWAPASVKLDDEGRLYVTESSRHRIQVYQRGSGT